MTARRLPTLLLGVLIAALPTACGIPRQTDVQVVGQGPVSGGRSANEPARNPPIRTDKVDGPEEFIKNYLLAPAGEIGKAYERANNYRVRNIQLAPPRPGDEAINIVRLGSMQRISEGPAGAGTSTVTVSVLHVGVLRGNGVITEPTLGETEYDFTVGPSGVAAGGEQDGGGKGWFLLAAPQVLLMDEEALKQPYYQAHSIYFWNTDRTALIPDLRYLPKAVPPQRQATEVLSWLIGGPARWLTPAATRLPEGTTAIGNVPDPEPADQLEVNLSVPASVADREDRLDDLITQLVWSLSLPEQHPQRLELKINNKTRKTVLIEQVRQATDRPLYRVIAAPARFCVYAGQVRAFGDDQLPETIDETANQDVVSAGLSRGGAGRLWAALVVRTAEGRHQLRTAVGPSPVRDFVDAKTSYATMSRPIWLKSAGADHPAGLVVADGQLYRFDAEARLTLVAVPEAVRGRLSGVAPALDGHRVALVAGGRLYVAALTVAAEAVSLGTLRPLPTTLTGLTAVDWNAQNGIVVAGRGRDGKVIINHLRVDASGEGREIQRDGSQPVIYLAAYPHNPTRGAPTGNVLYGTQDKAYAGQEEISPQQIGPRTVGSAQPAVASPDASGVEPTVTAPFFYY